MIISFTMKRMHGHTKFGFRRCRCHGNDGCLYGSESRINEVMHKKPIKFKATCGFTPMCQWRSCFSGFFFQFFSWEDCCVKVHHCNTTCCGLSAMEFQAHEGCQTGRRLSPDGLANCLHTSCTSAMACFRGLPWRDVKRSLRSPGKGPTWMSQESHL